VCPADHSDSYNAEVKNERSYTSIAPHVLLAWCLIMHRGNLTAPNGYFIQGDQKVSVHLLYVLQSSAAQRLFDHPVCVTHLIHRIRIDLFLNSNIRIPQAGTKRKTRE
jgi:hypothetical protein